MPHLDDAAVRELLDPVELVDVLESVVADLATGAAATTVRVRAGAAGSMASAMAAALPQLGVTGGKVYATVDGRFTFHVVLFDLAGALLCTMDGAALTEARTPALSAVAIGRLARPGATTAALIGTGREAIPHLRMLQDVAGLEEIRVWGRRADAADAVAAGAGPGPHVTTAPTADAAVSGADIVVTLTAADDPVVAADAVAEHALVCAVGATKPQRCELDPALFSRAAAVITDSPESAPDECGDLIRAVAAGTFEWDRLIGLPDVLSGRREVRRAGDPGIVVFETQGIAAQDVAAAAQVWRRSRGEPTIPPSP